MTKYFRAIFIFIITALRAGAQKPFTEGVISYKVKLETIAHKEYTGTYTFIFKGAQLRKELSLSNGYQDIVLFNTVSNTIYSLQTRSGKKYAIQLSMDEYVKGQEKFSGFQLVNEPQDAKTIAGYATQKGAVKYRDGITDHIRYSKEWCPAQSITFERFPDAKFFPLSFSYTDEHGMTMYFEATKMEPGPVENGMFRVPGDCRIISYAEYKELSK
jgi:hypothetical protein